MALGPASDGSSESSVRSPTRLKPAFSSARRDAWLAACGTATIARDLRIEAEDMRHKAGDGGRSQASPALRGLADQIVNAGRRGNADGAIPVGVVLVPVALDDADRLIGHLDDEDPGRVGAVRSRPDLRSMSAERLTARSPHHACTCGIASHVATGGSHRG